MPPNRFESEVESFLEGSHGDRTHIKRADHHTVTPLCGTLLGTGALLLAVLTLQCAAKPYWWHGGQPAQAAIYRVNVRGRGPRGARNKPGQR